LLGVRYSNWESDTYYSLEAAYDILNNSHQSFVVEGYLGRTAAIRNWDLTYGLGATWYSSKVINYNVGLKDFELTDELFAYSTGAGYTVDFEISAQTPISESWVFEIALEHTFLSSNIKNSPLVVNDNLSSVLLGFSYVF
jgi:MipA family protein